MPAEADDEAEGEGEGPEADPLMVLVDPVGPDMLGYVLVP